MHIEFKNLCNASKHMNMHISNANNQWSWACSPYFCAFLVSKNFDPSSFLLMLLPCPCPSLISPPWSISFVVQLIPWSYLCSNFSPFVINFHKGCVIPIKSLDTNQKSVNLIVTKDCIGIDGWGLNLLFLMDITIYVGMILLELLLRYHLGSLTLIPFGGALPLSHPDVKEHSGVKSHVRQDLKFTHMDRHHQWYKTQCSNELHKWE